jgi:hypothetical protein
MQCYECGHEGRQTAAVVLCHHCSAGLCDTHSVSVDDPVLATEPLFKTAGLPLHARLFFCRVCLEAVRQGSSRAA